MVVSIGTGQSCLSLWHFDPGGQSMKTKFYEEGAITAGQIKRWDVLMLCGGGGFLQLWLSRGGLQQFTLTINSMFAPTINYAHFHAAITPHPAPRGPGESPRPYLDLYCNDDP